jgi:choline dehydrogenase-like flavoprotein
MTEIGRHTYGARYAPLDPIDFEKRDYLPYSGWPISRADLDPFYARAQTHCGIGPYEYETPYWERPGLTPIRFTSGRLRTSMFQFGPKDVWTRHYQDVTTKSNNLTTIVNGTVMEIEVDEGGTNVTGVRATNPAHQEFHVRAKHVILATGCIENARLLLLSRSKHRDGLGNQHDVVGRYFMDHPQSYLNVFTPNDRHIFDETALYDLRPLTGYAVMGKLTFSEETLRREQLQNICFVLFPRRDHFMSDAFQSFFTLALTVIHRQRPSRLVHHLKTMVKGSGHLLRIGEMALRGKAPYPYIAKGGWAQIRDKSEMFTMFEIFSLLEQAPDSTNRITLSDELDPNGQPKVHIHWMFTERDQASVKKARRLLTEELSRDKLGTVQFTEELYTSPSSVHPTGSTRMSADPHYGVVDANCQVHGLNNLYLAGSSVFPTNGYANPTLTAIALGVRLADYVKGRV